MKKILFITGYFLIQLCSYAQDKGTWDVGVSLGAATTNELVNILDLSAKAIVSGASADSTTYINNHSTPAIGLYVKRAVMNNWFVYADAVYQSIREDVLVNNTDAGDVSNRFMTLGLGTEYHYIHKDWFQMYSGAAIGCTWYTSIYKGSFPGFENVNEGYVNFHINALGFRFGKELAGMVELGVGYKGIASMGLSYQF